MMLSQFILEKKEKTKVNNETMHQDIENIDTYETRKIRIRQNLDQSMSLGMKLISKSIIFYLRTLSENVKIIQMKHNLYQVM